MFSFLNPAALWALPAAAAPLLIHLVLLRRARRLPFSDLTLLREAYRRSLPSSRLRQWLLLASRCLALAALVLAFARPVVHPAAGAGAGAEETAAVVFLVDASYSMGLETRGRSAARWAAEAGVAMLGRLKARDRVAVAAFSDRIEGGGLEWASDPAAARAALEAAKPGTGTTDYRAALSAAYAFLKGARARRRVVVLLSDGAAHGAPQGLQDGWLEQLPGYDPDVLVLGLAWPEAGENGTVATLRSEPGAQPGLERLDAKAALAGAPRSGWDASLWQRDAREDVRHFDLAPGPGASLSFALKPAAGAATWGRVELRRDALALDDAYYFALRTRARPRVLLAHGGSRYLEAGRGGYFWTKLFAEDGATALPYALDVVEAGRWSAVRLEDYRAVILADFAAVPAEIASGAERFARAGGGLLVLASPRQNVDAFKGLARALPGRLGPLRDPSARSFGLRLEQAVAQAATGEERAASPFSWKEFELQNVAVAGAYELEPAPGAQVWFRDASGRPLLAAGAAGAGRAVVWASSLDLEWTNLGLKPAFAAWADLVLGYLTRYRERRQWRDLRVGRPLVREWNEGEAAPAVVRVRAPDGRRAVVRVVGRKAEYGDTRLPGVYLLESEGQEPEPFAVNLERGTGEWDPARLASPPWRVASLSAPGEDFLRALYGREARGWALALLLALLLAENWLCAPKPDARSASGRGPAPGAGARRAATIATLLAAFLAGPARAQEGDKFVWTQLRYDGAWDPYPTAHSEALQYLGTVTSILSVPERRVISLRDPEVFTSPLLVLTGRQAPPPLGDDELRRLRDYLTAGGLLWIEDASGQRDGPFDRWVRRTMRHVFPDVELAPLGPDHVVHKTFFLLRSVAARTALAPALEGVSWGGRTVLLYSRNDALGPWARDALGNYLYECLPGGEAQRLNARKLTLNIVMYALTGNYKSDAVHQPYLLQKMRSGAP
ncbi:MAG: DUF4159 domain-containing protein [Elusimicrobia bacterium]|nr:DUF4159 domain-containing protein [Elusimicrobiota bacterium]